jgi:arginyl-tRNA synthetase
MNDQNIFAVVLDKVRAANNALVAEGALPAAIDQSRIVVEPPREAAHGDMATNAAMVLAKDAGKKPRELAEAIAAKLRADDLVAKAEVAGPGFINLTLKPWAWVGALRAILSQGACFGRGKMGQGSAVNVEYVSANPTGPMHVGHCRGAVFGDALANLLAFSGYNVTREYYVNDAGAQGRRARSLGVPALPGGTGRRHRRDPEGLYPGDYLKPVGAALAARYGRTLTDKPEAEWLPIVRDRAIEMMMAGIRDDLKSLNVVQDVFFSERSLIEGARDDVGETIAALRRAGYVYEGRLPPPKGAPIEDWEDREQTLFRATDFGDDVDRPLMKSDGSYTYFASDIAYHKTKVDRGFTTLIDVWGADHGGLYQARTGGGESGAGHHQRRCRPA